MNLCLFVIHYQCLSFVSLIAMKFNKIWWIIFKSSMNIAFSVLLFQTRLESFLFGSTNSLLTHRVQSHWMCSINNTVHRDHRYSRVEWCSSITIVKWEPTPTEQMFPNCAFPTRMSLASLTSTYSHLFHLAAHPNNRVRGPLSQSMSPFFWTSLPRLRLFKVGKLHLPMWLTPAAHILLHPISLQTNLG